MARYLPMNWVPRWFEAYYTEDSSLRKIYSLGLVYHNNLQQQLTLGSVLPTFYGKVAPDRYLLYSAYSKTDHIPNLYLYSPTTSAVELIYKDSLGSLLYSLKDPCFCVDGQTLYLKNLDMVSYTTTSASGFLDISPAFVDETLDEDSPLLIVNEWEDLHVVDQSSPHYFPASGHVYVPTNGTYTVYYRSSSRLSQIVSGIVYVTLDNERLDIYVKYIENQWDYLADLFHISRNKWETNTHLKTRNQHLTLARTSNQRIAATLGATIGATWYTSGSIINVSGYNDWQFQDYERSSYRVENPIKYGAGFLLSAPPTGYVQLFLNGTKLSRDYYTVIGSFVSVSSSFLVTEEMELIASYKTQNMWDRQYPESQNISTTNPDGLLYRGILVKDDVAVLPHQKKILQREWRWNKQLGKLNETATFDF